MSKSRKKKSKASSTSPKTPAPPASSSSPPAQSKVFLYRAIGKAPLRPVVSIEVEGPAGVLPPLYAVVDSGADKSLFPEMLMSHLGVDAKDCPEIDGSGAGGATKYKAWSGGTPCWNRGRLKTNFMGRTINLNAWFGNTPVILLGREDFFWEFRAAFDERKKTFRLEAY